MGLAVDRVEYAPEEFPPYSDRLYECLEALASAIRDPAFGRGARKIGAELELCIVDGAGQPLPENLAILDQAARLYPADNPYTVELNRHNLEINAEPQLAAGEGFLQLEKQLVQHWHRLEAIAVSQGGGLVAIGILPTLTEANLLESGMTAMARYQALSHALRAWRGEDFRLCIEGSESLDTRCSHVAPEGANTSFQFHLMVEPAAFADTFNAVQLTTPLVLAAAANSPCFLERLLWDETRIALFKQSIDCRNPARRAWHEPARVAFGHGWVRADAWELFAEAVALYPPMFPVLSSRSPLDPVAGQQWPALPELALHMGTTWHWNRPVYEAGDGGSVRIEMRALPAGPSVLDMMANAALATGLAEGLKTRVAPLLASLPFRFAEQNLYRAARHGLDAELIWPDPASHRLGCRRAGDILASLLPLAEQGLLNLGMEASLVQRYLSVISERLERNITGARWQRQQLADFAGQPRRQALAAMLSRYRQHQASGAPVHTW